MIIGNANTLLGQDEMEFEVTILILPFLNKDNDMNLEYLSHSLKDQIATVLSRVSILKIIQYEDVENLLADSHLTEEDYINETVLTQIADQVNCQYIISGEYFTSGQRTSIIANVYNTAEQEIVSKINEIAHDAYELFEITDTVSSGVLSRFSVFVRQDGDYSYNTRPVFFWIESEGATYYKLYLDDAQLIYMGDDTTYTMEEEIDYGEHSFYLLTQINERQVRSDVIPFTIKKLQSPIIADKPTKTTYDQNPRFIINPVEGANEYKLLINDQLYYQGTDTIMTLEEPLSFGNYEVVILASNNFQTSITTAYEFEIQTIQRIQLSSPIDTTIFSESQNFVNFVWSGPLQYIFYDLYVDGDKVATIEEGNQYRYEHFDYSGDVEWYVVARSGSQSLESNKALFEYRAPQIKFSFTENNYYTFVSGVENQYNFLFNGLFNVDWLHSNNFALQGGIGFGYFLMRIDSDPYYFQANKVLIEYTYITLQLGERFFFDFDAIPFLEFSIPAGISLDTVVQSRLSVDGLLSPLKGLNPAYFNIYLGAQVTYLISNHLEVTGGFFYQAGVVPLTKDSIYNENTDHRVSLSIGFTFYKI